MRLFHATLGAAALFYCASAASVSAQTELSVQGELTAQAIATLERLASAPQGWQDFDPEGYEKAEVRDCRLLRDQLQTFDDESRRYIASFHLGDLELSGPTLMYPELYLIWGLDKGRVEKVTYTVTNASENTQKSHESSWGTPCEDGICIAEWESNSIEINVRGYDILPPLHEVYLALLHMKTVCKRDT